MKTYENAGQLIGKTPLIRLGRLRETLGLQADILAKAESFNTAGSVKDRIARSMVDAAEQSGQLKPGGTLVEASSGNTGIGLALLAAMRGYKLILTMPDTMSLERRQLLNAYGATLVLTPGDKGMPGAMEKAEQITRENPGSDPVTTIEKPSSVRSMPRRERRGRRVCRPSRSHARTGAESRSGRPERRSPLRWMGACQRDASGEPDRPDLLYRSTRFSGAVHA